MNWRQIFEERCKNDISYRIRIERFRSVRDFAIKNNQKLRFQITPTGFLNLFLVKKEDGGFFKSKREELYPIEHSDVYSDSSCSEIVRAEYAHPS